jgi:hypothetical protein
LKRAAGEELGVDHERRGFPSVTYWRLTTVRPTPYIPVSGPTGKGPSNPYGHNDSEHTEIQLGHWAMDVRDLARLDGQTTTPHPSDDGFLDFILAAHRAGHITTAEALEREQTHKLIQKA